ncbi:hypothetical protein KBC03_04405 [Patescibacteria group bacterium]|nr:hypothetical protein [Patescibacteria group bacterium]
MSKLSEKNGIVRGVKHLECYDLCKDDREALQEVIGLDQQKLDELLESKGISYVLQLRYRGVQAANTYMQITEPRIKLKSAETMDEGKQHLEFLLYVIKQLALLSAPFLLDGFAKTQQILGNEILSAVTTDKSNDLWKQAWELEEFDVALKPDILYQKLEVVE